ncbi:hypothetical protein EON65_40190 [archaeon]|nr:MAG: hypothetical protein EON65_40190 [archaeon]
MEARHRGLRSSGIISPDLLVKVEDPDSVDSHYHCPTPSKDRRSYSRTTLFSIIISIVILLVIGVVICMRLDVIHTALWQQSGYKDGIGSTMGHVRYPSGIPSLDHIKSRIEQEHIVKKDRQSKLIGKDKLSTRPKKPTGGEDKPAVATSIDKSASSSSSQGSTNLRGGEEIASTPPQYPTELDLPALLNIQMEKVKHMKYDLNLVMEQDPAALVEIALLQSLARQFVVARYGPEPYFVRMTMQFPESMADPALGSEAVVTLALAPLQYMPYAVFYFMQIVENFKVSAYRLSRHYGEKKYSNSYVELIELVEKLVFSTFFHC